MIEKLKELLFGVDDSPTLEESIQAKHKQYRLEISFAESLITYFGELDDIGFVKFVREHEKMHGYLMSLIVWDSAVRREIALRTMLNSAEK